MNWKGSYLFSKKRIRNFLDLFRPPKNREKNGWDSIPCKAKGSHTRNNNRIQSSESQVNLCMYGGGSSSCQKWLISIRSDLKYIKIKADDCCVYGGLKIIGMTFLTFLTRRQLS